MSAEQEPAIDRLPQRSVNRVKSTVYTTTDNGPWSVTQIPAEVAQAATAARAAGDGFIELTLMFHEEDNGWNGRRVYIDPWVIVEIAPVTWGYQEEDD